MTTPQEGQRNILITSALPYVNNYPHLGNIIGSTLSADVFARYCRGRGYNTLFICGSDEYGTATETKAIDEGVSPRELCDKYYQLHANTYEWFNIKFDKFGRTSTPEQTEIAQDIFLKLQKNGYLEEKTTVQPYCEKHCSFLADRFVEGICSICGDAGARDAEEPSDSVNTEAAPIGEQRATGYLINPHCKLDGATPIKRESKHFYIKLDALKDQISAWFKETSVKGSWSANAIQITQSWIDRGLRPRAITRDLTWGTPVPPVIPGYEGKCLYVWFEACMGYISITATHTTEWEKWWKNPSNVQLYQFMGKDNVSFHTIIFPGSQLGTGEDWTTVHHLSTTEYLNYEGGKFSKSKGVGVFGNSAKDTGVAPDVWRYYLISRRPEQGDTEFKWSEFIDANNSDLLKNLGNFVNRVLKFVVAKYDSVVPEFQIDTHLQKHEDELNLLLKTYIAHLEAVKLRAGKFPSLSGPPSTKLTQSLADVMHISALGNKLLQDNRLDNRLFADAPARCAAVIGMALNHIHLLAAVLEPFMPDTSAAIRAQLGGSTATSEPGARAGADATAIPAHWTPHVVAAGQRVGVPALLFTQIKPEREEEWRVAFGGEEVKRQQALAAEKKAAKAAKKARKKQGPPGEGAAAADSVVQEGGVTETRGGMLEETTAAVERTTLSKAGEEKEA